MNLFFIFNKYIDMINYKQILEAVNRGIKFALDDFENQDDIQGQTNSKVKYQGGMKEYLNLMRYEVVDLGLPSGTLWCKYNLDVNPDQLTKPEDWYGKYYAWGELEGNKTNEDGIIYFNLDNYKFGKGYGNLTKYCNNLNFSLNGFTDNLTKLLPEDDAAYQFKKCHNYKFYIPTKDQFEELLEYTDNKWIKNYNRSSINGRLFVSKINGNSIFIPAAGFHDSHGDHRVNSYCYLWSSSLSLVAPDGAYYLDFNSNSIGIYSEDRYRGFTIRPVINL